MRKTLLFGNGLGMALDQNHFYLPNALQRIWDSNALNPVHKQLISACLPHQLGNCPQGEDELDKLHVAISSCEYLSEIRRIDDLHWLSPYGWDFPSVCRSFITQVATHLYDFVNPLPEEFGTPLVDFVRATKSHVATLNYDKLLYDLFINNHIVNGFSGSLVDGVTNAGFNSAHLERKWGNNFGYYLHLHGSPLFKNRNGTIKKLSRYEINLSNPEPSCHIVLTHIRHKPTVISSSEILSSYWQHLYFSLSESYEVILFGYSGLDNHLNILLSMFSQSIQFKVVEWAGSGDYQQREAFWSRSLRRNVNLIHLENILNFHDWQ
jgi:hypothetical protein